MALRAEKPGWAEEDPAQWWANVCEIVRELLAQAAHRARRDRGDRRHRHVAGRGAARRRRRACCAPASSRATRAAAREVAELRGEVDEAAFLAKAGNGVNQQLDRAKLRWIERHEPQVFARIATVFGSYDYINWRLTGERAIEQNWALEAGFVDLATHAHRRRAGRARPMSRARRIPRKIASHEILGRVSAEARRAKPGLRAGTPVVGGAADIIASALGAGVVEAGRCAVEIRRVGRRPHRDRSRAARRAALSRLSSASPGSIVPNGCMSTGGSALNWFARNFAGGEAEAARSAGPHHRINGSTASPRPSRRAPRGWSCCRIFSARRRRSTIPPRAAIIDGLTLSHDIGHLWRALLEAYAYAIAHHVEALNDIGHRTERFIVSDGGSASRVWMQIVADVLQRPLQRLNGHPGSCLGAAWTAAIGAGLACDWSGVSAFVTEGDRSCRAPIRRALPRRLSALSRASTGPGGRA